MTLPKYTIYAIREMSTGFFLPSARNNFSITEPCEWTNKRMPRFFRSYRSAHTALISWSLGVWRQHEGCSGYSGGYEPPDPYYYYAPENCGRDRNNLEVV